MTIQNEFQSNLYRNTSDMLAAIAYEWLTAGGSNSTETVSEFLSDFSPKKAAEECISGWGFDEPTMIDADETGEEIMVSHMALNDYTASDLEAAFAAFAATRLDMADAVV